MQNVSLFEKEALENQKSEFWSVLHAGGELDCPCCGRYAKIYRRQIHHSVARQLIAFYHLGGHNGFIHISELKSAFLTGAGDFTKAKYWDLLDQQINNDDPEKKHSGLWFLTEKGRDYVLGRISIPKYVIVFDDKVLRFSDELSTIQDALGNKFNYEELMEGELL